MVFYRQLQQQQPTNATTTTSGVGGLGSIQAILGNNSTAATTACFYLTNNVHYDGKPWYPINRQRGNGICNWDNQRMISNLWYK